MQLSICFRRIVATRADLKWKVETMSLLFRPEDRDQVKAIFAQKQVA
jgi:hypothetical protein